MSMNVYNVVWADDEIDTLLNENEYLLEDLEDNGIKVVGRAHNGKELGDILKASNEIDAIIVDANFNEGSNPVTIERGHSGLDYARNLYHQKLEKSIPMFLYTGRAEDVLKEMFKDNPCFFEDFRRYENWFSKSAEDELDRLLTAIKKAVDESKTHSFIIRNHYRNVFEGLSSLGISDVSWPILRDILTPLHYPEDDPSFKPVQHYNQLRQVLEYLFRACNKVGVLPDQCLPNEKVNLHQCSCYLAGKDCEIAKVRYGEIGERVVPNYIENIIRAILEFGNIHSHTVDLDKHDSLVIENIFKTAESRYLIFGLALQLCEVVIWFSDYLPKHNDKEINLFMCKEIQREESVKSEILGGEKYLNKEFVPVKDENGIWHCEECYVRIDRWDDSKMLLIEIVPNTDARTKEKYPYYARYKKIYK